LAGGGMMVRVESTADSALRVIADLPAGVHTLGGEQSGGIWVDHPRVSGRHANLEVSSDGTLRICDLGSSNGTWIEGRRLPAGQAVELRPGEVFGLSRHVLLTITHLGADSRGAPAQRNKTRMEG
jgi:pSer/pThr/pTyr-binding forkhead associated (FHA) protein